MSSDDEFVDEGGLLWEAAAGVIDKIHIFVAEAKMPVLFVAACDLNGEGESASVVAHNLADNEHTRKMIFNLVMSGMKAVRIADEYRGQDGPQVPLTAADGAPPVFLEEDASEIGKEG